MDMTSLSTLYHLTVESRTANQHRSSSNPQIGRPEYLTNASAAPEACDLAATARDQTLARLPVDTCIPSPGLLNHPAETGSGIASIVFAVCI
ncbi:MAG: hypothetical protein ACK5ZG_14580 [Phycisphaerae bacterium]|jgi:hypothetical protein